MRWLDEFVRVDDGQDVFDANAFDRVLRGYVTPSGAPEPVEFFQGNRLKLPHFTESRELSAERAKIVKQMWSSDGKNAPEVSWAEVNRIANTGYQSFDDAFGGKAAATTGRRLPPVRVQGYFNCWPAFVRKEWDPTAVATLMQGDAARLCFTSPPYGNQRDYTSGGVKDWDGLMAAQRTGPQTRGQLTAVTGQVVDGAVVDDGHGLMVGRRSLTTFAWQCRKKTVRSVHSKVVDFIDPDPRALWTSACFRAPGVLREMAGRERTRRRTGLAVQRAKSASFRINPQEHGATRAIAQEKTPTQTSWGFAYGGGTRNRTRVRNPS
jgi:hypothetical protein